MSDLAAPLLTWLLAGLTGHAVVDAAFRDRGMTLMERLAWSLLAGAALVPAALFLASAAGLPLQPRTTAVLLGALAFPGAFALFRPQAARLRLDAPGPMSWLESGGAMMVFLLVGFGIWLACIVPMNTFDATFHWAYKAKILFHTGSVTDEAFRGVTGTVGRIQTHPDYPLLVPMLEAVSSFWTGSFSSQAAKITIAGFFPLAAALTWAVTRRELGRPRAILTTLFIVGTPMYLYANVFTLQPGGEGGWPSWQRLNQGGIRTGTVLDGGTDLPVGVFLLGAVWMLRSGLARDSKALLALAGLFSAGAAFTKNEGLGLILPTLLAGALACRPRRPADLARLWPWTASLGAVVVPWLVVRSGIPAIDEGYGHRVLEVFTRLERLPQVAERFITVAANGFQWGLLWILLMALVLLRPGRALRGTALIPVAVVGFGMALYAATILVTPWDLQILFGNQIPGRLFLHLAPTAVLALGLLLPGTDPE